MRRGYLYTLYLDTWVPGYTWVHLSLTLCMQAVNLDHELPNQPSTDVPESVSKRLSFRDKVIIMIISDHYDHDHRPCLPTVYLKLTSRCFTSTRVGRQASQKQPLLKIPGSLINDCMDKDCDKDRSLQKTLQE